MYLSKTVIVLFHSYPRKPCIDGLMSAILAIKMYQEECTTLNIIPYWRTHESFLKIKDAVENVKTPKCHIVYVDCSPDLEEEVEYLLKMLPKVTIFVNDHHPLKDDSPINKLIGQSNFDFNFDANHCASKMMFKHLTKTQQHELGVDDLITIIQYSEYEGMNAEMAGKEKAQEISVKALEHVKESTTNDSIIEGVSKLLEMDMGLFYILDQILAEEKNWKFLTEEDQSSHQLLQKFIEQSALYLKHSKSVVSGSDIETFNSDRVAAYIKKLNSLPGVFSKGTVLENQNIGGTVCQVLALQISIFDYGRALEPMLKSELERRGAAYAILMNSPSKTADGKLSYYFSLRRVSEEYDARKLATYILEFTGSKVGGGHPWASGVTLNEEQYKKFKTLFQ